MSETDIQTVIAEYITHYIANRDDETRKEGLAVQKKKKAQIVAYMDQKGMTCARFGDTKYFLTLVDKETKPTLNEKFLRLALTQFCQNNTITTATTAAFLQYVETCRTRLVTRGKDLKLSDSTPIEYAFSSNAMSVAGL